MARMAKGSMARVGWLLALALALWWAAPGDSRAEPAAKVLDTEAWTLDKASILVRGAFQVTGEPHLWFGFYVQVRLDADTALQVRDDKGASRGLVKHWGNVFMPAGGETPSHWAWTGPRPPMPRGETTARWTECRVGIPFADLEAAANLPKGRRTLVWIVGDVFDCAASKYIASGWDARTPLFVTTDRAGKVTAVEFAYAHPFVLRRNRDAYPTQGLEMQLKLTHLKPKPGVQLCRAANLKHEPYSVLVLADRQTYLWTADRGFFFEPIDAPQKAVELFQLPHGGAVVVKTRQQFDAIVKALTPLAKKAEPAPKAVPPGGMGMRPGPMPSEGFKLLAEPPSFGVTVTEEPGVGYRIRALLIEFNRYTRVLGDIRHHDLVVTTDGRIGDSVTLCVKGPEAEYSRPPMWVQPGPTSPGHYDELLRGVLKPDGSEAVPRMAVVTAKPASFPSAEGDPEEERFFTPPDRWPAYTKE